MTAYNISVVSDTVCPWCYIGKHQLERAIQQHRARNPDDTFTISWHPYYLNPDAPKQSIHKSSVYAAKFGSERTEVMQAHLARLGKEIGIDFKFGGRTGHSRDSHRLIRLGHTKGGNVQTRVAEEIFAAYFEDEEDITDIEVLIRRGVRAGLQENEVRQWMISDAGGKDVDENAMEAQKRIVMGVPNFTINERFEVDGAQEPAIFLKVFAEIKRRRHGMLVELGPGIQDCVKNDG